MERALENAGLKTAAEGGLEFSLKDQSGRSFADSGDGAGDKTGHGSGDAAAGEQPVDQQTALERVAAYARNAAGGLDIRV
jgi:flagellar hook-length control protein FliK